MTFKQFIKAKSNLITQLMITDGTKWAVLTLNDSENELIDLASNIDESQGLSPSEVMSHWRYSPSQVETVLILSSRV